MRAVGLVLTDPSALDGTANPYRYFSSAEQMPEKRTPPSGETKAGIVGCVGSIRLWSLTLQLLWNGLMNRALHAFPRKYVCESSSSLAHLGNSPQG